MLKGLYGMLVASLLYYKKFRKDIETKGFNVNPYNPCVANRIIKGIQQTVTWHVDDLKSSHVHPTVNNKFYNWLEKTYGLEENGLVTSTRRPNNGLRTNQTIAYLHDTIQAYILLAQHLE
jgi:hypothetical protein